MYLEEDSLGTLGHATSASDVIAIVHHLVDAAKDKTDDPDSISLAAANMTEIIEHEVIPEIQSVLGEVGDILATRFAVVQRCDVSLRAASRSIEVLQHDFQKKLSEIKVCVAEVNSMDEKVSKCLERDAAAMGECALLEASHAAKVAESDGLRAEVEAAACARASHAYGVCQNYGNCRASSKAAYDEAVRFVEAEALDRRTQLLQAKHAQCITRVLVSHSNDMDGMLEQLKGCDNVTVAKEDQTLDAMPPAMNCEDAAVSSCSDGLLTVDVGFDNETWNVPCGLCSTMEKVPDGFVEVVSSKIISSEKAFGSLEKRFESSLSSAKDFAEEALSPHHWSASTSDITNRTLSVIGIGAETTVQATGQASSTGQLVILMLAIPLVALGATLCVTIVFAAPGNSSRSMSQTSTNRHGSRSHLLAERSPKELSNSSQNISSGSEGLSIGSKPQVRTLSRGSLPPEGDSPTMPISQAFAGLCPQLSIPEGAECILGIPTFVGMAPGDVMLKSIVDIGAQPLLHVGLTSAPESGESILLATKTKQELAYTETGNAVRAEGWAGKIFRWDGELYAQFREADVPLGVSALDSTFGPSSVMSLQSASPGANVSYIIVGAQEPKWVLRMTGSFQERRLTIRNDKGQVMADVTPGTDLAFSENAGDFYRMRLGPNADSGTLILALMAVERLYNLGARPASSQVMPRSSSHPEPSAREL